MMQPIQGKQVKKMPNSLCIVTNLPYHP